MTEETHGFNTLPDLTHPWDLSRYGVDAFKLLAALAVFALLLGVVIALIGGVGARGGLEPGSLPARWAERYERVLLGLQHGLLVLLLLAVGFLVCSTLARRYHYWEQARVDRVVRTVAGDRLEQPAPAVEYRVVRQEEVREYDYKKKEYVQVTRERTETKYLDLAGSRIQVKLDQFFEPPDEQRALYRVDYRADYDVVNTLDRTEEFYFQGSPPAGYTLLQSFKVERDGARLQAVSPESSYYKFALPPGGKTRLRVAYQAQGGPRWIYDAGSRLLSNFQLTVQANFASAEFASGILPTSVQKGMGGTVFTWDFKDNVSVKNPFGVFTATARIRNTGVLPRLLLLAPGILAWWLLLLYLAAPPSARQVVVASLVCFAALLAEAYFSRLVNPVAAWAFISLPLLAAGGALFGAEHRRAAIACTAAGVVLPVFGLLIPYTGLTLSLVAIGAAAWLSYDQAARAPAVGEE